MMSTHDRDDADEKHSKARFQEHDQWRSFGYGVLATFVGCILWYALVEQHPHEHSSQIELHDQNHLLLQAPEAHLFVRKEQKKPPPIPVLHGLAALHPETVGHHNNHEHHHAPELKVWDLDSLPANSLYRLEVENDIHTHTVQLSSYAGKLTLVVWLPSCCFYQQPGKDDTEKYMAIFMKQLAILSEDYFATGLTVLAFPLTASASENEEEMIHNYLQNHFPQVQFAILAEQTADNVVYQTLKKQRASLPPLQAFQMMLMDRSGMLLKIFDRKSPDGNKSGPDDFSSLRKDIEQALQSASSAAAT
jgi:glutathione peroxidase-family protein